MTRIPDLERALHHAAQRLEDPAPTQKRPSRRWRAPVLATVVALSVSGAALAASGVLEEGDPVPPSPALESRLGGIAPGTTRVLNVRAADPDAGLPWTIRVFRTNNGRLACIQVGRVQNGQLGVIGRYGAFQNDGAFHRLPVNSKQNVGCGGFTAPDQIRNSGITTMSASGASDLPTNDAPAADTRIIRYGFAGPRADRVELRVGDRLTSAPADRRDGGAYILVTDGRTAGPDAVFETVYTNGLRCPELMHHPGTTAPKPDPRCARIRQ